MADAHLSELWKTQKSLTEWLEDIKHKDAATIRREDNDKRERLKIINRITGLPFDEPIQFNGSDLTNNILLFRKYLKEHGNELCALRLMPLKENLPKLRMRGKSVSEAYEWFLKQDIDASKYKADFVPHADNTIWATIFVVNVHGLQGEITRAGHHELTQGFHKNTSPSVFRYDFKKWTIQLSDGEATAYLKTLAEYLYIPDKTNQQLLSAKLGAKFVNNYLSGYFETTHSKEFGTWFIDYNQSLGAMYEDFIVQTKTDRASLISGRTGSPGKAMGPVKVVSSNEVNNDFPKGAVLVCEVTTPDYVPLMQKASAIVTDQGGILSHAAIIARELKKPCIVGTQNATKKLRDGQIVSVNADIGIVNIL